MKSLKSAESFSFVGQGQVDEFPVETCSTRSTLSPIKKQVTFLKLSSGNDPYLGPGG